MACNKQAVVWKDMVQNACKLRMCPKLRNPHTARNCLLSSVNQQSTSANYQGFAKCINYHRFIRFELHLAHQHFCEHFM